MGLGRFLEAGAGVSYSAQTVPSFYADFVDPDGTEVDQDLHLRTTPDRVHSPCAAVRASVADTAVRRRRARRDQLEIPRESANSSTSTPVARSSSIPLKRRATRQVRSCSAVFDSRGGGSPRAASSDISMPLAICRTTSAHPGSTSAAGPTTSRSVRDSKGRNRDPGFGIRDSDSVIRWSSAVAAIMLESPGPRVPDPGSRATVRAFIAWIYTFALSLGGPGLFTVAFLDSSFVSLPQINDILVVLMVTNNKALMPYYAFMATAGSVAGCYVIYYLAKKGGEAFVRKRLKPGHVERTLALYKRHGLLALMVLRSCHRRRRSNCSCWPQAWRRCDRCNSCWRLPSRGAHGISRSASWRFTTETSHSS